MSAVFPPPDPGGAVLELAPTLVARLAAGERLAVATVTAVDGSAPRELGTSMAVGVDGRVSGSISGGCLEGAVVQLAAEVLDSGSAVRTRFGIDDETAFSVGLSCGGELDVVVRELGAGEQHALDAAAAGRDAGAAFVSRGPAALLGRSVHALTDADLTASGVSGLSAARLVATADARIAQGATGSVPVACEGAELEMFVESRLAPPAMLLYGAVDHARALADAARLLGYRVTVVDAREVFATPERFPSAHEVVEAVPHRHLAAIAGTLDARSVVLSLTHEARVDVPLLAAALRLDVAYVGALGSRRTHARREAALREAGVTDAQLARLHSPVGLDLGAVTPEETAVSILAEIVAERARASGRPLRATTGPIHPR